MTSSLDTSTDRLGSTHLGEGRSRFQVWAPEKKKVELRIHDGSDRLVPLSRTDRGYHAGIIPECPPGTLYRYRLDGDLERPDPASRSQPEGVHGPSRIVDDRFQWSDQSWKGLPLQEQVIYEIHVGAFTDEGTFDAVIPHLDHLRAIGFTTLELMPVAQNPGDRNWGYDGVYLYAVQHSYGGADGLKRLVDACHSRGMAVCLDVVYNHLGPEGNYLWDYGPYFTDRYKTPWGDALNFDGPHSDEVRRFFIENAVQWVTDFHIDMFRLDATDRILDFSASSALGEISRAVEEAAGHEGRQVQLIAETGADDPRWFRSPDDGGHGMTGIWNDPFHHCLHTLLTGESRGYYEDYGRLADLAKAHREGFVYTGQYSPFRKMRHGASSRHIEAHRFVVFAQNHDQVGNRMLGERLGRLVPHEGLKLAAAVTLLSPNVPLVFMGEEYDEVAPFFYFVSHGDANLIKNVRRGRRREFAEFSWQGKPPDPQDPSTFHASRLDHGLRSRGFHHTLQELYQTLLSLRRSIPALACLSKEQMDVIGFEEARVLMVRRWAGDSEVMAIYHFGTEATTLQLAESESTWRRLLDSEDERWGGPGARQPERLRLRTSGQVSQSPLSLPPLSFVIFQREA